MKKRIAAAIASLVLCPSLAVAEPSDWTTPVPVEEALADLSALYDGLQSAHYDLYVHRPKHEYDQRFAATMATLGENPLTRYELLLALQTFTAYGNVAHARIDYPSEVFGAFREAGGKALPIFPRIIDGRMYVGENYSGLSNIAVGDEILVIDGAPIGQWLDAVAAYISADTPAIAHSLLEFTFPMYLWVEVGERQAFDLKLRDADGLVREIFVPARTRNEIVAAPKTKSFTLDSSSRASRMLTADIAYLRPGPFYNFENPEQLWDVTAMAAFLDAAFEEFINEGAASLIIDLRDNPGGDNSFSDPMIAWIADRPFRFASKFLVRSSDEAAASNQARLDANPGAFRGVSRLYADAFAATPRGEVFEFDIPVAKPRDGQRFNGDVYVLVNRHSYSNAVNVAAIFQDYGWGVIAGEKTTDMATTYGAMEHFALPHSGFRVGFPKAFIVRPSGDETVDGVTPDLAIPSPIGATADDVVLKKLIDMIESK